MTSFSDLLDKPAEDYKRPPAFPNGTYLCQVGRMKIVKPDDAEKSPYYQISFKPLRPFELPDGTTDLEPEDLAAIEAERWGKEVFSKKFYITPDALHTFTKGFCSKGLGVNISGKTVKQVADEVPDKYVGVTVKKVPMYNNPDEETNDVVGFINPSPPQG